MDWKAWALTSSGFHILILAVCFLLVYCHCWPSLHHRKIKSLNSLTRDRIKEVVDESWEELINCAKNLIDAQLEDGKKYHKESLGVGCSFRNQFLNN